MGLLSAMGASVSGMAAQAYYLATISENISNSNTTGYKEADTLFQDLVDQIGATGDYSAGGVSTVVRYNVAEQGSLISTASPTDLAIQGNGFFLVQNSDGATFLTRAGSFVEDSSGNLVNSAGYTLMGYSLAPGSGGVTGTSAGLQPVNVDGVALLATPSTSGTFTANLDCSYSDRGAINHELHRQILGRGLRRSRQPGDLGYTGTNTWEVDVYNDANPARPLTTQTLNFNPANGDLTAASPQAFPLRFQAATLSH